MPRPTKETRCSNCQWFGYSSSICKRYPPTYERDLSNDGGFPEVHADYWCGEFTFSPSWGIEKKHSHTNLGEVIARMEPGSDKDWLANWLVKYREIHRKIHREIILGETP